MNEAAWRDKMRAQFDVKLRYYCNGTLRDPPWFPACRVALYEIKIDDKITLYSVWENDKQIHVDIDFKSALDMYKREVEEL